MLLTVQCIAVWEWAEVHSASNRDIAQNHYYRLVLGMSQEYICMEISFNKPVLKLRSMV